MDLNIEITLLQGTFVK